MKIEFRFNQIISWPPKMVQLKLNGTFLSAGSIIKQWGPSLSDCLEIYARLDSGVANKGTWKIVSFDKESIGNQSVRRCASLRCEACICPVKAFTSSTSVSYISIVHEIGLRVSANGFHVWKSQQKHSTWNISYNHRRRWRCCRRHMHSTNYGDKQTDRMEGN